MLSLSKLWKCFIPLLRQKAWGARPGYFTNHDQLPLSKTSQLARYSPLPLRLTLTFTHNAPGARPGLLLIWPHY